MAAAGVYRRKAREIAVRDHLDPDIFEAQIGQESGFNPSAHSPAGADGIAQFMPGTARGLGVNTRDPISSLKGAAKLDSRLLAKYGGDWKKALAAYNAGEGAVDKYHGVPPFGETQAYVHNILSGKNPQAGSSTAPADVGTPESVQLGQQTTVDQAGFEQAQKRSLLANFLTRSGKGNSVLFKSGLLSTTAPSQADFTTTSLTSKIVGGDTTTSGATGGGVHDMLARAVAQSDARQPYQWGGGHGPSPAKIGTPLDCSGYVSQILGVSPRVAQQYMSYGAKGPGQQVTIYAKSSHVLIEIHGRWFATSTSNPGHGAGEIPHPSAAYLSQFVARHPAGL